MSVDKKASYYDAGGIETIEIIKAKLTKEQFIGFLLGNQIKYACRMNFKGKGPADRLRDAEKAAQYESWLIDELATEVPSCATEADAGTTLSDWRVRRIPEDDPDGRCEYDHCNAPFVDWFYYYECGDENKLSFAIALCEKHSKFEKIFIDDEAWCREKETDSSEEAPKKAVGSLPNSMEEVQQIYNEQEKERARQAAKITPNTV